MQAGRIGPGLRTTIVCGCCRLGNDGYGGRADHERMGAAEFSVAILPPDR